MRQCVCLLVVRRCIRFPFLTPNPWCPQLMDAAVEKVFIEASSDKDLAFLTFEDYRAVSGCSDFSVPPRDACHEPTCDSGHVQILLTCSDFQAKFILRL